MHNKDTYLRLKQTPIPHLYPAGNTQLLYVCLPGRAPGGNTTHSGVHCVRSCFSSLLFLGPRIFRRNPEKLATDPIWQKISYILWICHSSRLGQTFKEKAAYFEPMPTYHINVQEISRA